MRTVVLIVLLIVGLLMNVYFGVCFVVADNARDRDTMIEVSGLQAFLNIVNLIAISVPFIDIENATLPFPFHVYVLFWALTEIVLIIRAKFV